MKTPKCILDKLIEKTHDMMGYLELDENKDGIVKNEEILSLMDNMEDQFKLLMSVINEPNLD